MSDKIKKSSLPILVTVFLWAVWSYSPIGDISRSFIKLPEVNQLYSGIFFGLLLAFLLVFREKIERTSWLKVSVFSTLTGYFVSLLALVVAEAFVAAGGERLANSIQTAGLGAFLATQLFMTGICAGWFYGLLGALGTKSISKLAAK